MYGLIAGSLAILLACRADEVVGPGPAQIAPQTSPQAEGLGPAADTYVSKDDPFANFGTDSVLRLDATHRPLLRWDTLSIAQAVGDDSLVSAQLELTIVANDDNWGTGDTISLHPMSYPWTETGATWFCADFTPGQNPGSPDCSWGLVGSMEFPSPVSVGTETFWYPWRPDPTATLVITNGLQGVITFDVTADVAAILAGSSAGPYVHGWLLKKVDESSGSSGGGGKGKGGGGVSTGQVLFGSRESASAPRLILTTAGGGDPVPATPPDSLPLAIRMEIYADSNMVEVPGITGLYPRDVVWIAFQFNATQQERQQAVDLIGGEVVGGMPLNPGGIYVVRIPHDGTGQPLADAIAALEALPQIRYASPDVTLLLEPNYRRPNDGLGWQRADWNLTSASPQVDRWGLEAIAAPLAWGCATGGASESIGVVDVGFQDVPDMRNNVAPGSDIGVTDTTHHGTSVASIIAAEANNDTGMTGVMWQASMLLSDGVGRPLHPDPAWNPFMHLDQLAKAGIPIINFSSGYWWQKTVKRLPGTVPGSESADSAAVRNIGNVMYDAVTSYRSMGLPDPLFVLSASNDGIDAWWSGTAQVVDSSDVDHVLVVTAIDMSGALASFSNRNVQNSLVELAAPGVSVGALDDNGQVVQFSGVSAAVPFATGVAGLLRSFDPDLSAQQLKQFLVEGAVRGGGSASGIPILNAYESLRRAAEEPGAPLCGQEVWAAGGMLQMQRVSGGSLETLAPVPNPVAQVEVLHGGKFIRYLTLQGSESLGWDPATRLWSAAPLPANWLELRGGTLRSVFGLSHDQDSVAFIDDSAVNGTLWFLSQSTENAPVFAQDTGSAPQQVGTIRVDNLPSPIEVTCLERDPNSGFCFLSTTENRAWLFRLGYPQFPQPTPGQADAYLTIGPMQVVRIDSTAWAPCSFDPSHECRVVTYQQDQTEAQVYTFDLAGPASGAVPVDTIPQETVFWVGEGENGEEVVLQRGRWQITLQADADHFYQTGSPFFNQMQTVQNCEIEYRQRAGFAQVGSPISSLEGCDFGTLSDPSTGAGAGTIAPNVQPRFQTRLQVRTTALGATDVLLPILEARPTGSGPVASRRH